MYIRTFSEKRVHGFHQRLKGYPPKKLITFMLKKTISENKREKRSRKKDE